MTTSDADDRGTPKRASARSPFMRAWSVGRWAFLAIAVAAGFEFLPKEEFKVWESLPWSTISDVINSSLLLFVLCTGAVAMAFVAYGTFRIREPAGESRERLNHAERELEHALRGARSTTLDGAIRRTIPDGSELSSDGQTALDPDDIVGLATAMRLASGDAYESPTVPQGDLTLAALWKVTHARLDHYHEIATGQAKVSFRNAQVSMGVGFILLVLFVVLALNASTTAGAIVAGGLGAVSGALSGYVAKTFIRSQEAAATHLRSYFDQPLEHSRYLAAERLIADGGLSQEQRTEVLSSLVQAIVTGPQQPLPADSGGDTVPGR